MASCMKHRSARDLKVPRCEQVSPVSGSKIDFKIQANIRLRMHSVYEEKIREGNSRTERHLEKSSSESSGADDCGSGIDNEITESSGRRNRAGRG